MTRSQPAALVLAAFLVRTIAGSLSARLLLMAWIGSQQTRQLLILLCGLSALVAKTASRCFSPQDHDVLNSPKTRVHVDDARHYLQTTDEILDAITADPLAPWVEGVVMLRTTDCFELAEPHLDPAA